MFKALWCSIFHQQFWTEINNPAAHWPVWASLDYGFNHPTVVYLLTENDGVVYIVGEYWARRQLVPQNADGIKAMLANL